MCVTQKCKIFLFNSHLAIIYKPCVNCSELYTDIRSCHYNCYLQNFIYKSSKKRTYNAAYSSSLCMHFFSVIFSSERQDLAKLNRVFLSKSRIINHYKHHDKSFEGCRQVTWTVYYGDPRIFPLIISYSFCHVLHFGLIEDSYFMRVLHLCDSCLSRNCSHLE